VLGVDQHAVRADVEHAAAAFDQLGLDPEPLLDLGRQTGGLGQVASAAAVVDGDSHRGPPSLENLPPVSP